MPERAGIDDVRIDDVMTTPNVEWWSDEIICEPNVFPIEEDNIRSFSCYRNPEAVGARLASIVITFLSEHFY